MSTLVMSFLLWIAAETGLIIATPPSVVLVSLQEMQQKSGRHFASVALYMRDTSTVYLPSGWNGAELYDQATLLHELVHHMQNFNRVPSECNAQRERQAYDLTRKWLEEQGVADPYGFLNTDELTVTILSACLPLEGSLTPVLAPVRFRIAPLA
jgi:hypothetical protein